MDGEAVEAVAVGEGDNIEAVDREHSTLGEQNIVKWSRR